MTDFDYKKYSLKNLENWMHDAMSADNVTAKEIYDTIHKVVSENYYHHKHHASQAYELLTLLNGNSNCVEDKSKKTYDEMIAAEYWMTDDGFWMPPEKKNHSDIYQNEMIAAGYTKNEDGVWELPKNQDKVVKWQLPVSVDGLTGECYVNFPDDLLEVADLKEGDQVEWVDNNDGSYILRKVNGSI